MKPLRTRSLTLLAVAFCVSGCTLAPDYQRPELPVPAAWPATPTVAVPDAPAAPTATPVSAALPWQEFYRYPPLQQVITLALDNNRDLRVAALRIEQSRAQYQIEGAALYPHLNASGGGNISRVPADLSGVRKPVIRRQYSAGLGVSAYELDFFGRVRSLKEEALQAYFASSEAQRSAQLGLVAEVASRYLSLAANREGVELATKTLEGRTAAYTLIEHRYNAGLISALDLQQAQTTVDAARVDLYRYTRLAAQDENALQLLVGAPLAAELLPTALPDDNLAVRDVEAGLPSETLLNRPDILGAEHHLQGVTAHIGAARAAFFPSITLTGSLGTASTQLDGLFKSGSGTWSFIPQINIPLFAGGANRAQLKAAEAEQKIAVAEYEGAIQTAFREVADALAERATLSAELAAQQSLTAAYSSSFTLAEARYNQGVDSYLVVLDAQRSLFAAQQGLIATRLARMNNLVTLYKVLGGGVEAEADVVVKQ